MKRNNQTPTETPEQICARAVAASADIVADLRGLLGVGNSRALLGQVAEAAKREKCAISQVVHSEMLKKARRILRRRRHPNCGERS